MSLRGAKRRGNLLVQRYDTGNPKAMVEAHTIHPPAQKIQPSPGRFPRRFTPRNDIIFNVCNMSLPLRNRNVTAGACPRPTVLCRYCVPFIRGIATPVCGLVRNDVVDGTGPP